MIVKSKRSENGNIRKLAAGGEIKELFVKEDILNPKKAVIEICFKGNVSSGILEISSDEAEKIYRTIKKTNSRIKVLKA